MMNVKTGFRTALSMLEDDPFFGPVNDSFDASPADEADSIFSVSRTPSKPAPEKAPQVERPVEELQADPVRETPSPEPVMPRIEDPVLKALLAHDVLDAEQLALLMPRLQSLPAGTLPWRAALDLPGVSQEHILAVASHVNEIPFVDLREHQAGMMLLTLESLPESFKQQCNEVGLLPFALEFGKGSGRLELKAATYDPLRPEIETFLSGVQMPVQVHYAPVSILKEAIQRLEAEGA